MGAMKTAAIMPLALLALACSKSTPSRDATLSQELRRDLNRAAAPTSDLASAQFRPTQVVSAVELGEAPTPKPAAPVARKHPVHRAVPSPKPRIEPVKAVALDPSPAPTTVAVVPAPEPTTAGPRPAPNPVQSPTSEPEHHGGIGSVIGVIIRGGVLGDDDHCQIRPPIAINSRIPPMGRPTSPGRPRGIW
jgi:hypothetical protein